MKDAWSREPAMFLALIQSGLALSIAFGTALSAEQVGAIMAFSAAALGLVTRSKVSPDKKESNN